MTYLSMSFYVKKGVMTYHDPIDAKILGENKTSKNTQPAPSVGGTPSHPEIRAQSDNPR